MAVGGGRPRPGSHVEVEGFLGGYALIPVRLETGRTHQIRAHFAAIGNPLAGDRAYGGGGPSASKGQFLHAAESRWTTRAARADRLCSPLPADLRRPWMRARAA